MPDFDREPINIELDLRQEDFIQAEILENLADSLDLKSESLSAFFYQSMVCLVVCAVILISKNIVNEALVFPGVFFVLFLLNFLYKYYYGIQNELNTNLNHIIQSNRKGNVFFTPERGVINLFADRGEYLTNENRRYFNYTNIAHIKNTKLLYVFVMKHSKDKALRGFVYMLIPKRCLSGQQTERLNVLCKFISEKYNLTPWIDNKLFDE